MAAIEGIVHLATPLHHYRDRPAGTSRDVQLWSITIIVAHWTMAPIAHTLSARYTVRATPPYHSHLQPMIQQ